MFSFAKFQRSFYRLALMGVNGALGRVVVIMWDPGAHWRLGDGARDLLQTPLILV